MGDRECIAGRGWRFLALLGLSEAEELWWYLEKFIIWPSEYFRNRTDKMPRTSRSSVGATWAGEKGPDRLDIDDRSDQLFDEIVDQC